MAKAPTKEEMTQAISKAFDEIDADKSGFLDHKEIVNVLKACQESPKCKTKMSTKDIDEMAKDVIKVCDKNNDNKISKKEFIDFVLELCK